MLGIYSGLGISHMLSMLISFTADYLTIFSFIRKEIQPMHYIILALGVVADKDLYTLRWYIPKT